MGNKKIMADAKKTEEKKETDGSIYKGIDTLEEKQKQTNDLLDLLEEKISPVLVGKNPTTEDDIEFQTESPISRSLENRIGTQENINKAVADILDRLDI